MAGLARDGSLTGVAPDDMGEARDSAAGVFRIGVSALARLKVYDALAGAVLSPSGQPLVRWWPVAYALQWMADPRACRRCGRWRAARAPGRGRSRHGGSAPCTMRHRSAS